VKGVGFRVRGYGLWDSRGHDVHGVQGSPVRVCHGDLVRVGEERGSQGVVARGQPAEGGRHGRCRGCLKS
jgi:hypothetical protein